MKKIIATILLISTLLTLAAPISVSAAANEKPNYTKKVESYSELESRLDSLIKKYQGTYWTTNGKAANSSGSTSRYYYGIQCKGFASYIFNDLYCSGYIGSYDKNKYYIPSPNGAKLIDKKWDISSNDTKSIKSIISKGQKGDLIQVRRRGKTWGHTMILVSHNDNGLYIFDCNSDGKCGVKLYYQSYSAFASKNIGMSLYHSTKYPIVKPSQPTIKSCKAKDTKSIEIKWDKVSGADKYKITRTEVDGKNPTTLTSSCTGTAFTDTKGLKPATTYYYQVYAIDGNQTSDASKKYKTYTKPEAPTIQTIAKDSETQLTIKWNKVSGAHKYKLLYRKIDGKDSDYQILKNNYDGTSYTHKGLSAGSKYAYRVVAQRIGNLGPSGDMKSTTVESANSSTRNGFTNLSLPGTRNELNDNGQVVLHWNKSTSDAKKCTYHIYRKAPNGNFADIGNTTGLSFTDTSAVSGVVYKYYIKAVNTSADNKDSNGSQSIEFYASPKVTKEINLAPQSASSVKISWDKPQSETGLQYIVKREKWNKSSNAWDAEYTNVATVTQNSYEDKGLITGEKYRYYIQLRDKSNHYLTSTHSKEFVMQILPDNITLNKTIVGINIGEKISLTATILPENSTNKSVTWTSSNTAAATVSQNGLVSGVNAGETVITAKSSNGKTAICKVTVKTLACTHEYGGWIIEKEAGCTETGKQYKICSKCSDKEEQVISAAGHSYSADLQIIKEASCTENGEKARVCTKCGNKTDNEAIEAAGHSFPEEWTAETSADCQSAGTEYRLCSECGMKEIRETEAVAHDYELVEETETTPDGPGHRTFTCKVCSNTVTEEYVPEINQGTLEIESSAPQAGGEITVPVTITDNPGIAGFRVRIYYDKSVLVPKSIKKGAVLTAGRITSNIDEPGIDLNELEFVSAVWENSADMTQDGVLFNVTFEVKSIAPEGKYDISLEYDKGEITTVSENVAYYDVMPNVINGSVTISDILKGDINLDRKVNPRDAIVLSQYLAGWRIVLDEKQITAADVFTDLRLNAKDSVKLSQMLLGYGFEEDKQETPRPMRMRAARAADTADDSITNITVESFDGNAGSSVYIPVTVKDNAGIAGFDIKLSYDKDYLTPVSIEKGDILTDGEFISNLQTEEEAGNADYVTAFWNNADNLTEDGTLFIAEFLVNDNVQTGQKLPVEIIREADSICDRSLNNVNVEITQGEISIVEHTEDENTEIIVMPYDIADISMSLDYGTEIYNIPANGDFDLSCDILASNEEFVPAQAIAAAYDADGGLISLKTKDIAEDMVNNKLSVHIDGTSANIDILKIFVWDTLNGMKPLSDVFTIARQAE